MKNSQVLIVMMIILVAGILISTIIRSSHTTNEKIILNHQIDSLKSISKDYQKKVLQYQFIIICHNWDSLWMDKEKIHTKEEIIKYDHWIDDNPGHDVDEYLVLHNLYSI